MRKIEVLLTREELWWADRFAEKRVAKAEANECEPGAGLSAEDNEENGLEYNRKGVWGEMSVAKGLNRYWTGMTHRFEDGDVGRIECRCTDHPGGHLLLQKKDKDNRPYVLVIADPPNFTLVGWLYARDGKKEELWCDGAKKKRWSYWVPQPMLHDMQDLPNV